MDIKTTRSASRSMQLYGITKDDVRRAIKEGKRLAPQGNRQRAILPWGKNPQQPWLRVVWVEEVSGIIVISVHPRRTED